MPKSCIPGYDEAIRQEKRIREEAFLDVGADIGGVRIKQITPFLWIRLRVMETPFLTNGDCTTAEILRFLWALSPDFTTDKSEREVFCFESAKSLADYGFDNASTAIDLFIRDTFMDSPSGVGPDSVPYVIGPAWLIYKMACEPFKWNRNQTLHTPIREIYQLTRCHDLDNGRILYNEISDSIKAKWLDNLNSKRIGGNN